MSVWLCQIGKNIWYDQCRKNKRLKAIEDNKFINNNLAYTTEELVIEEEEKIMLYKKIQKLDEKTREVMYLRLTGELTFKEISNILDKTENWVRVIFYRGKNKLKEEK